MMTGCQWKETNLSVFSPSPVVLGVDPEDRETVLVRGIGRCQQTAKENKQAREPLYLMFTIPSIFEAPRRENRSRKTSTRCRIIAGHWYRVGTERKQKNRLVM